MLEAKNIHKDYKSADKTLHILKGVDISVGAGEFVAIAGPSGAGKSTLLHILGGLDKPSRGSVLFQGRNIYSLVKNQLCLLRNKSIGFVFQFYHLLGEFNVFENVLMPALIGNPHKKEELSLLKKRADELIESMGLGERKRHFPSQISGGEKQRVAIARALINNPDFLFCDEPTGNLDSKTGQEVISLIKNINKQRNTAVVMVTHNQELSKQAGRIYNLKDGMLG